jgi:hypothetical protein
VAQRYDGPAHSVDKAWALSVDNSGNVYVTGLSKGVGSDYDFATSNIILRRTTMAGTAGSEHGEATRLMTDQAMYSDRVSEGTDG